MREEELRRYFLGEGSVGELAQDLRGSVTSTDLCSTIRIADMQGSHGLIRHHVLMLCDAFLERALTPEDISAIAFALLASDHFEWDDDVISEVLADWSAPEINFELNDETIKMHRGWLLGSSEPPSRRVVESSPTADANLISVRIKSSISLFPQTEL
jgi:hypothetical protein